MSTKTLLTVEQFLELPQVNDDDRRFELWQGELLEMGETIPWHNWVRDQIFLALTSFLGKTKMGVVLGETGVRLDSSTLYRPDVVFWDSQHWAAVDLHKSGVEVIPQLVVEVKSPSNTVAELFGKANYYIRSGVHTVWVVTEDPYEVHVFEAGGGRRLIQESGTLEAPAVLPEFSAKVAEFLPRK